VSSGTLPIGEAFPLVPRHTLHGLQIGPFRSSRRGTGSDTAGSRAYEPGDDVRLIDWPASARLSTALQRDEFIVRERFAEQAPRVVILVDRRPAMALHPSPWLSKPSVVDTCERLIAESAFRARGLVGGLHFHRDVPRWAPPTGSPARWQTRPVETGFDAATGMLAEGIERIAQHTGSSAGSFLFVLSDFLDPVPDDAWLMAVGRGWDVVPVVIQDPTWEASFPVEVAGLVLPVADPTSGEHTLVRLSAPQAADRRDHNRSRLRALMGRFAELGLDPVSIHEDDFESILAAFTGWSAARLLPEGRAW
jgi:uncharacterized protein (DUF58 family)